MANFVRERSDRDWYRGLKIPHTVIRNIDEKTKKAVSGTGGNYNPSSLLTIGGAGLELQGTLNMLLGKAQPTVFRFGDDDYFKHRRPVIRTIVESCTVLLANIIPRECGNDSTVTMANQPFILTRRNAAFLRFPLRIPNGTRLEQVLLSFAVGVAHANVPANLPKIRVVRISRDGTIEKFAGDTSIMSSFALSVDSDGWLIMNRPASGAAYFNAGNPQTLSITFNPVIDEIIDTTQYAYALEFVDEWGANSYNDMNGGTAIAVQANKLFTISMKVHHYDLRPY